MNAPNQPAPTHEPVSGSSRFISTLLIVVLLVLLLLTLITSGFFEILVVFGFGWIRFLTRTLPRISFNRDLAGMALLCAAGILCLANWSLRWLTGQIAAAQGKAWQWPWRWTWCGTLAMGVVFLTGMSLGGIAHQTGWMLSSHEPWYEWKGGLPLLWTELRQFQAALEAAMMDAHGDLEQARRALKKPQSEYYLRRKGDPMPFEKYHCLLMIEGSGKLVGGIVFPRDVSRWGESQVLLYWWGAQQDFFPMTKLPALLQTHQGQLLSL